MATALRDPYEALRRPGIPILPIAAVAVAEREDGRRAGVVFVADDPTGEAGRLARRMVGGACLAEWTRVRRSAAEGGDLLALTVAFGRDPQRALRLLFRVDEHRAALVAMARTGQLCIAPDDARQRPDDVWTRGAFLSVAASDLAAELGLRVGEEALDA